METADSQLFCVCLRCDRQLLGLSGMAPNIYSLDFSPYSPCPLSFLFAFLMDVCTLLWNTRGLTFFHFLSVISYLVTETNFSEISHLPLARSLSFVVVFLVSMLTFWNRGGSVTRYLLSLSCLDLVARQGRVLEVDYYTDSECNASLA